MKVVKGQFLRSDFMEEEKEKNLDYIKKFTKITITGICKKLSINRQNVLNGKTTSKNIKNVKEEIESELAKLYIKG